MKALVAEVRAALRAAADPARAPQMQAYMKSTMPYLGVTTPARARALRPVVARLELETGAAWRRAVLAVWRQARFREERYAAIALSGERRFAAHQDLDALPVYEEMIVTGAWWDYVDEIAARRLGPLLRRFPREMKRAMLAWSRGDELWKRRSAILCQLTFKRDTDLDLLYRPIEPALGSPEFFLRKAIGWALRQYAWTDPAEVRRYVRAHEARLSPLSCREALKHAGPGPRRLSGPSPCRNGTPAT
jgi:3-methyladenine DNA glycosylase AlkD